jgi:hypothetical protein
LPNRPLKKPAITLVEAKAREEGWLILFETNARWESVVVARLD